MICKWLLLLLATSGAQNGPELWKSWSRLDPSAYAFDDWSYPGTATPNNNVITGVKVWGDRVFVSIPRWKEGVPVTLAEVRAGAGGEKLLHPFPSYDSQRLDGSSEPCTRIRYVQSMEIDPMGRMWILDVGRVHIFGDNSDDTCPPKMILWDIAAGRELARYSFPEDVFDRTACFPNDLVLDTLRDIAYISDTQFYTKGGGIVALRGMATTDAPTSLRVWHPTMRGQLETISIDRWVLGPTEDQAEDFTGGPTATDGIALTKDGETLVYSTIAGYGLFALDVSVFRDWTGGVHELQDSNVRDLGYKAGWNDGLGMSASGILYYGSFQTKQLWSTHGPGLTGQQMLPLGRDRNNSRRRDVELNWIDTFAWGPGALWFTTNNLHEYFKDDAARFDNPRNMAIWRMPTDEESYMPTRPRAELGDDARRCMDVWEKFEPGALQGDGRCYDEGTEQMQHLVSQNDQLMAANAELQTRLTEERNAAEEEAEQITYLLGFRNSFLEGNYLLWFGLMWLSLFLALFLTYTTYKLADGQCRKHCCRLLCCQCNAAFRSGHGVSEADYRDIGDGAWETSIYSDTTRANTMQPAGTYIPLRTSGKLSRPATSASTLAPTHTNDYVPPVMTGGAKPP